MKAITTEERMLEKPGVIKVHGDVPEEFLRGLAFGAYLAHTPLRELDLLGELQVRRLVLSGTITEGHPLSGHFRIGG